MVLAFSPLLATFCLLLSEDISAVAFNGDDPSRKISSLSIICGEREKEHSKAIYRKPLLVEMDIYVPRSRFRFSFIN